MTKELTNAEDDFVNDERTLDSDEENFNCQDGGNKLEDVGI